VGCANLTAWCSGSRGCALTRDVLLLDAVRLCAGVPARSTVCRDGDEWEAFGLVFGPFECNLELSIYRGSPGGTIEVKRSAWWSLIGASG
ncbi:unnamed protein product, partial [Prunus brigantina]